MAGPKLKALVTGGAGFLGQHLVQQLQDTGLYDVTILDLRDTGRCKAPVVVADLRDAEQVRDPPPAAVVVSGKPTGAIARSWHCCTGKPTGAIARSWHCCTHLGLLSTTCKGTCGVLRGLCCS